MVKLKSDSEEEEIIFEIGETDSELIERLKEIINDSI
jgi:hypothetical protein